MVGRNNITSVLRAPGYPLELQGHPTRGLLCGQDQPEPDIFRSMHPSPSSGHQLLPDHLADRHHLCDLPATATAERTWQPAASSPTCVPGAKAGSRLHLRPPHHGALQTELRTHPTHSLLRLSRDLRHPLCWSYLAPSPFFLPIHLLPSSPKQTPMDLYSISKLNKINF